ncbi:uncharacterized protein F4817DRAFT_311688 [Daldinia loculata]|uniref:uncharacterized protein n=1 Tax=Daldinia loculata TaxID=103429 RepID=UPI0020C24B22|nr:uncharacterized protein F4817DRAFT_311688 [Daldinia loculata]KAI1651430.1 hypothetical protein F4817DRAFT_311688 [Daldinia loculata]
MRSTIVLGLMVILSRATPPMTFDCANDMQDICDNMCWGAYCTHPAFGSTLEYDNYGGTGSREGSIGKRRTNSAGCTPRPNRCSSVPKKNCDEYPFASTSDADKGGQVTKCVVSGHNSRQGSIISQYVSANCNKQKCSIIVGFGNPNTHGVKYCKAYSDPYNQCVPDGTIWKNGKADVRPPKSASRRSIGNNTTVSLPGGLYLMKSGVEVAFGANLDVGTKTKRAAPRNATFARRALDGLEDEEDVRWDFHDDEIVARLE